MKVKLSEKNKSFNKKFNYAFIFITVVWFIIGAVIIFDKYKDSKMSFVSPDEIPYYSESDLNKDSKIGVIRPREYVKVMRVLSRDDHQFIIQIQNTSGQMGWILKPKEINLKN